MRTTTFLYLLAVPLAPATLAAQDFNGDGFADLAVGVPSEDIGRVTGAGAVMVLYGSANRLQAAGSQLLYQGGAGLPGSATAGDAFGTALAYGDFDGDGYGDLAIGAPFDDLSSPAVADAGSVTILRGGPSGLSATQSQVWTQDSSGIADAAEAGDRLGATLTAGDFNGDGFTDLTVAATYEDLSILGFGNASNAGAVHVLYGSASGLASTGSQFWTQNTGGIEETGASGDYFGYSLAAGDIDGNDCDDLVIGVPYEDQGPVLNAGAVHVIFGTTAGLSATGDELWYQAAESFPDDAAALDLFGEAVAVGDFDGDGYHDLAIGAGHENTGDGTDAGMVAVLFGDASGLSTIGAELIRQSMIMNIFVFAEADPGDLFGSSLAAADYNGDAVDDLAIGSWNDHVEPSGIPGGSVDLVYGNPLFGLAVGPGTHHWNQTSISGQSPESGDRFGMAMRAGDFNGDGRDDLALGVPDEDLGAATNCGLVHVLYGAYGGFPPTATTQSWTQNSSGIVDSNEGGDRIGGGL